MKLRTRVPIDECKQRLASRIGSEFWFSALEGSNDQRRVLGTIRDSTFRLRLRPCHYRNSMRPAFFGQFVAREDDTFIEGHFGLRRSQRTFIWLWFGLLAVFGIVILCLPSAGQLQAFAVRLAMLVGVCVLALFGAAIILFLRGDGEGDEPVILDFLKRTLDANEVL